MKKVIAALAFVALATTGQTLPARAADTSTSRSGVSAGGYWSKEEKLRSGSFRITSWGISVYRGNDFVEGVAYHDVLRCKKRPTPEPVADRGKRVKPRPDRGCVVEESSNGTGDVTGSRFTIDIDHFNTGHLDTTFALQSYDAKGNPKGEAVPTHVVADWTGRGDVAHSEGTYNFDQGDCHRRETFVDDFREADASATFGSASLASAPFGSLGESSGTSASTGCPIEPGPIPYAQAERAR